MKIRIWLYEKSLRNLLSFAVVFLIVAVVLATITGVVASYIVDGDMVVYVFLTGLATSVIGMTALYFSLMKTVRMHWRHPLLWFGSPVNEYGDDTDEDTEGYMVGSGKYIQIPGVIELDETQKISAEIRTNITEEFYPVTSDGKEMKALTSLSWFSKGKTTRFTKETEIAATRDLVLLAQTITSEVISEYTYKEARKKRNSIRKQILAIISVEDAVRNYEIVITNVNLPTLDALHEADEEIERLAARAIAEKQVTFLTAQGLGEAIAEMIRINPRLTPQEALDAIQVQQGKKTKIGYEGLDRGAVPFINLGGGPPHRT